MEIFDRINKNDSAYGSVMVSKSYYLMALKKYDEALEIIDKGLKKNYGDLNASFYVNKGGYIGVMVPPISVKWCHFERYCNYS